MNKEYGNETTLLCMSFHGVFTSLDIKDFGGVSNPLFTL